MTLFLGSINFLEQFTELRKTVYLLNHQFITQDIKGYKLLSDKEIHRVSSEGILKKGASVPMELGAATLPGHRCSHQTRKLSEPHALGIMWRVNHVYMIDY